MKKITIVLLLLVSSFALAEPPPGHPSVGQAHDHLNVPSHQSLPYRAQVLESIPSNDYVYLRVRRDDNGELWLAAPRAEVPVQSYIRFAEGTVMRNFFSRKHKRTFDAVMFVKEIQLLGN